MLRRNPNIGFFDEEDTKAVIRRIAGAGKLTLFTGAGIAADLKIPNWSTLIARLLEKLELPRHADKRETQATVQAAIDSFHQLPTASIVDAIYRERITPSDPLERRNQDIADILYGRENDQVPEDALAIYVLRLAIVKRLAGCDVHIATTNYDDSLEHIADSRQDLGLGDLSVDGIKVFSNWDVTDEKPVAGVPVSHVHGLIPRSGSARGVVFSEQEYIEWDRESRWRDYLSMRLAGGGVTLFVGTSLRDYNIAAIIKRFGKGTVYALLPVEDEIRQAKARETTWPQSVAEYATLRGLHLGVQVLRPDFFGQVCQFLNEVAVSAHLSVPDYSTRLRDWSRSRAAENPYQRDVLLRRCERLREFAVREQASLDRALRVKAEIWVREDPDSRELQLYSSSQTVPLAGAGYWEHRTKIGHLSRYAAVSAFAARSATEGRVVYRNDDRWTHFLAVPIILTESPYFELPVGVMILLLHAPDVPDEAYFGESRSELMNELAIRMKRLGQEFLRPVSPA